MPDEKKDLEREILALEVEIADLNEELREKKKELKDLVEQYREIISIEQDERQTKLEISEGSE